MFSIYFTYLKKSKLSFKYTITIITHINIVPVKLYVRRLNIIRILVVEEVVVVVVVVAAVIVILIVVVAAVIATVTAVVVIVF